MHKTLIARRKRWAQLVLATIAISILWLIVLPQIGQLAIVRKRIETNEEAGINPTALFYTEHPGMRDTERRMESVVDHRNGSFWGSTASRP